MSQRRTPDEEADLETARLLIVELEAALAEQKGLTAELLRRVERYEGRIARCEAEVRAMMALAARLGPPA